MGYQHKRSSTAGKVPTAANIADGEILVNTADGRLFTKAGSVVKMIPNRDDLDAEVEGIQAVVLRRTGRQTVAGGFAAADVALSGIAIPSDWLLSNQFTYTNNGAFALIAFEIPKGTWGIEVVNGAGAGALSHSGFTKVEGAFKTTPGAKQTLLIWCIGTTKKLVIQDA